MSIVRTVKNTNYTTISNVILNDERLTWKARGIAAYLLSKPDDWRVNYEHLVSAAPDGKSAVLAAMKELEECGYITRYRFQGDDGRWRSEVVLHETPSAPSTENQHPATGEKPSTEKPTSGKPTSGKPTSGKPTSGKPTSGKPTSGKPTSGKSAPLLSTENQSLKPIPDYQSPNTQSEERGVGGETAFNGGDEGENSLDAAERSAAEPTDAELPAEVIAAWRWPLTAQARAFLRNAIRDYTAGEVLTALEIAAAQPREIERPAAYVKKVLQSRLSALVDDAERLAPASRPIPPDDPPPLAAEPPTAPTRPPRDVALVQMALAERLPTQADHVTQWPIRIDGATVTVNAGHRADWVSRIQDKLEAAVSSYLQRPVTLSIVNI